MTERTEIWFRNDKTGKEYKVLDFIKDDDTGEIVKLRIQGPNATFEEPYSLERFKAMNYTLVPRKVTTED